MIGSPARLRALLLLSLLALAATPALAAAAEPAGLTVAIETSPSIGASAPIAIALRVSNTGSQTCQVSASPAAATVTSVAHGQDAETPSIDVVEVEGTLAAPADSRRDLAPGASIRIPLAVRPEGLESLSPMPDSGSAVAQIWALEPGRDAKVTVALQRAAVAGCALPAPASATVQVPGAGGPPVAALAVFLLGLLAVVVAAGFLLRRRRTARMLVIVLALAAVPTIAPRPVDAVISNRLTGDIAAGASACFSLFRAPGGDPAGVFAAAEATSHAIKLENDIVGILQFTGFNAKGSRTPGVGADSTIDWAPTSVEQEGSVPGDPCAALYHLLAHAVDVANGTVDTGLCPGSLTIEEVRAVFAENAYRRSYNLPVLTTDRGKPLPASLSDCTSANKPKPARRKKLILTCGTKPCGSLGGDPHYRTYDAVAYDFQAVGEFVLTRSDDGSFEIQARQEAVTAWRSASVATAVAARIGSSRVTISAGTGAPQTDDGLTLAVDGAAVTGTGPQPVGGGSVERSPAGDQVVFRWPDGSIALATEIPAEGIDVEVKPAAVLQGHLSGLLGNDDGNQADDFRLADGTMLGSPPSFDEVHARFADAWRVSDATSLFDYVAGTSTATFTDRTYPGSAAATDVSAQLPAARDACLGLGADPADERDLADCAYDLAATGNGSFAAAAIDHSLPPADDAVDVGEVDTGGSGGPSPTPGAPGASVDRGPMHPGDTVSGTIGGPAERDVYELHADAGAVAELTSGGDCSPLTGNASPTWYIARASDPATPISSTIPFCVDLGRFAFPAAGDFVLVLDANGYTVPYSFTWTAVAVSTETPIVLGTDVTGSITTPGQRNTYLFDTTDVALDIRFVSPNGCDVGFVWKVTQNGSTTGQGSLCGTSQPVHLGGGGEWQIIISNPLGTGAYSFRIEPVQT